MPALQVAVDGRGVPAGAARRCNAGLVEVVRNIARRLAADIFGKDAPDDFGLGLDDFQLTGLAGNGAIAVGASAGMSAVTQHAFHAAPGMNDQVLDKHFAHQGA
nr:MULTISPECIES: hypothetical protein [unclassified Bradyrhizobium]